MLGARVRCDVVGARIRRHVRLARDVVPDVSLVIVATSLSRRRHRPGGARDATSVGNDTAQDGVVPAPPERVDSVGYDAGVVAIRALPGTPPRTRGMDHSCTVTLPPATESPAAPAPSWRSAGRHH